MHLPNSPLWAHHLTVSYDKRKIIQELSVQIPHNSFTVIIGPNACGKSTLLRALSGLLKPELGHIVLDGKALAASKSKEIARKLGLLPQSAIAPEGITAADLVARGRYPHQSLFRQWSETDEQIVANAMEATGTRELSHRLVEELSGGQRQRVWVAMALAQQTPLLLLDEPTTYLDIAHQIELMELFAELNKQGNTLVAVLHDLNHAARYATHLIAMKDGHIVAQGRPGDIVTEQLVEEVFDLPCKIIEDPVTKTPLIVPIGKRNSQ
ncbi:ABC transporter ATP-binding protein [Paenibacillus gorillae]|uniref:ABC transporter ATP-binding protein n=1 Tax=Paenibacillus gorillae TaxID=1243662 RepID=UPI0004BB65ED|nr:ABC transporter ATP-binding protein [Paenibacillus gorillae]